MSNLIICVSRDRQQIIRFFLFSHNDNIENTFCFQEKEKKDVISIDVYLENIYVQRISMISTSKHSKTNKQSNVLLEIKYKIHVFEIIIELYCSERTRERENNVQIPQKKKRELFFVLYIRQQIFEIDLDFWQFRCRYQRIVTFDQTFSFGFVVKCACMSFGITMFAAK